MLVSVAAKRFQFGRHTKSLGHRIMTTLSITNCNRASFVKLVPRGFQEVLFGEKIFNLPQNTPFNASIIFPFFRLTEFVIIRPFILETWRKHNEGS
jgi:hypothetical protein